MWEESTRVPLIFVGPGVTKGANCREPVELLDIYPTLLELCKFPAKRTLEGHSLAPQLVDSNQKRDFPAITTHNHDNHSVRSVRYRFIQYADGSEEFYDLQSDPNEWVNLASRSELNSLIESHRKFLPDENRRPAPGSAKRILERINGKIIWEGEEIKPGAAIPEL